MKLLWQIALIGMLAAVALVLPVAAVERNICLVKEYNLSFDVDPGYNVSGWMEMPLKSGGVIGQGFMINDSKNPKANALIGIISFCANFSELNSSAFSSYFENMMVGAMELDGSKEIGAQAITIESGQNVTIHEFADKKGSITSLAIGSIDKANIAEIASSLDINTTTKIIKSLEIKPS